MDEKINIKYKYIINSMVKFSLLLIWRAALTALIINLTFYQFNYGTFWFWYYYRHGGFWSVSTHQNKRINISINSVDNNLYIYIWLVIDLQSMKRKPYRYSGCVGYKCTLFPYFQFDPLFLCLLKLKYPCGAIDGFISSSNESNQ